jgi:hypothetical protein
MITEVEEDREPVMTVTAPDGQELLWFADSPHLEGDEELVDAVKLELVEEDVIAVTPTGPWVESTRKNQLAVFAAANRIIGAGAEWQGAPDVSFGVEAGWDDGPSFSEGEAPEEPEPTPASPESTLALWPDEALTTEATLSLWSDDVLAPLVAAFGIGGLGWRGMSKAERSAKAKKQLRDRFGRFAFMGGHMRWKGSDGVTRPGKFLGVTDAGDVLVADEAEQKIRRVRPDDVEVIDAVATLADPSGKDVFDLDGDGVINPEEARARLKALTGEEYGYDQEDEQRALYQDRLEAALDALPDPEKYGLNEQGKLDEVDGRPGPIAQKHFEALLNLSKVMGDEIDRRLDAYDPVTPEDEAEIQWLESLVDDAENRLKQDRKQMEDIRKNVSRDALENYNSNAGDNPEVLFSSPTEARKAAVSRKSSPERKAAAQEAVRQMDEAVAANEDYAALEVYSEDKIREIKQRDAEARTAFLGVMLPGSKKYGLAQREESMAMLSDIRPMGGSQNMNYENIALPGHRRATKEALDAAMSRFPADWHDAMREVLGDEGYTILVQNRGYHDINTKEIAMRPDGVPRLPGDNGFSNVSVHELSHGMELVVAQLSEMLWTISHYRAPRDVEPPVHIYGRPSEIGFRDKWGGIYSGKVYAPLGWEILSTGMESLMNNNDFFMRPLDLGGFDYEFRNLMLALLAYAKGSRA